MKNEVKKIWQKGLKMLLPFMLMVPVTTGISAKPPMVVVLGWSFTPPNPILTAQSSGSVSFAWDAISGAQSYLVYYYKSENGYTSSLMTTGSASITVSGLSSGTYKFYFRSVFEEGKSDYIIIEELVIL